MSFFKKSTRREFLVAGSSAALAAATASAANAPADPNAAAVGADASGPCPHLPPYAPEALFVHAPSACSAATRRLRLRCLLGECELVRFA